MILWVEKIKSIAAFINLTESIYYHE